MPLRFTGETDTDNAWMSLSAKGNADETVKVLISREAAQAYGLDRARQVASGKYDGAPRSEIAVVSADFLPKASA